MNNLNLCEILKGHEGETFYNAISGSYIKLKSINGGIVFSGTSFNEDGSYVKGGECMLFPSKDQRDWNKWIEEQKPEIPKTWSELVDSKKYTKEVDKVDVLHWYGGNAPIIKFAIAIFKIHHLIEFGYGGNVTDKEWRDDELKKWYFIPNKQYPPDKGNDMWEIVYSVNYERKCHIAFHTNKQAEEFLSYPENVQLLRDYFQI